MNAEQLKDGLTNFYGTEQWYRHALNRNMLYTDGVQFFAENAGNGAYWFLDIIATEVWPLLRKEPFIRIVLFVGETAAITADDGNDNIIWSKGLDFTDCPPGKWEFYLTDNVMLLPSEY